jgi:hypothetical protein
VAIFVSIALRNRKIHEAVRPSSSSFEVEAIKLYNQALKMWDGKGFNDIVFRTGNPENKYATYKLAVFTTPLKF